LGQYFIRIDRLPRRWRLDSFLVVGLLRVQSAIPLTIFMPHRIKISASILSADFTRLGEQIKEAEQAGVDWIHIDVMDGHFVPNLTMGPFIVEACRKVTSLPLDVHLMVNQPEKFIRDFASAGASNLSIHIENNPNVYRTLQNIQELGCFPGIVLNPGTSAYAVKACLHLVKIVLVMSVNPGFSGQRFLPEVLPKVTEIRAWLDQENPQAEIEIDGGLTPETLPKVFAAGASVFVAATSVFKHPEGIVPAVRRLRTSLLSLN
jgi:ribulose-phosphate 3-epimerase